MRIQIKKTQKTILINFSFYFCFLCLFIFSFFFLAGCSTAGKGVLPKKGDMTMADIYKQETGLSINGDYISNSQARTILKRKDAKYKYTTALNNETQNLFKPLPNPEIAIYVYPHLVNNTNPVPGYTTAFFLYQENHFAMPEEDI